MYGLGAYAAAAGELVPNGGFETGSTGWGMFVPDESQGAGCGFDVVSDAVHSGTKCGRLFSDDYARFSIGPGGFPAHAGEHYRVTAWVRADSTTHLRKDAPGFVIRLNLRQGNADAPGGHLFIELGNRVLQGEVLPAAKVKLTLKWTMVGAVVEIPPGVDAVIPSVFSWGVKGNLYVDDLSIEKVDTSVPATSVERMIVVSSGPAPNMGWNPNSPKGPVTADADLLAALNLDTPGMEKIKAAAGAQGNAGVDWAALQGAYLDYRRTASPARWRFMPSDRPAHPTEKDDALGDEVMAHHVRNGYGTKPAAADMGKDFNWTYNPVSLSDPSYTDEWTYCCVSRTEFWQTLTNAYWTTGNEKYAAEWVAELRDFALKNPMHYDTAQRRGQPSLWRTLDAAERISISWPNSYFHCLLSPSFTADANWLYLKLNYEHAELLLHGLADPTRTGNWVAVECGALYTIGALFPEFRDAASWRQIAADRISKELSRAVPPDGFEAELTPTYHFVTLMGFRQPLEMARLNHLQLPADLRSRIVEMYRAPVLVMDQSGHDVATNDSTIVDIAGKAREGLQLADDPLLEWAASRGRKGEAPPLSDALPYAGFYAMRGGWKPSDTFLFFRAGPTGIGHNHESDLEVVLRAWGKTLLFETGSYPYDASDWRRFAINSASHSTILVDGKWQHAGKSNLPVSQPTDNPWVTTPMFDYVAGTFDAGYQVNTYRPRPYAPEVWTGVPDKSVSHTRRVLFLKPYYALVLDTLDGTGTHTFDAHFQMDASSARLDPASHAAFSQNASGAQLALYPLETGSMSADIVQGQKSPLLGWMPVEHRPIPMIRFRKQQEAPAVFATFLYPYLEKAPDFEAAPLAAQGDGIWTRSLKTSRERIDIAVVKSGTASIFSLTSPLAGDVHAEATGLVIRQPAGMPMSIGAWNLRAYSDAKVELTSAADASLVVVTQGDSLVLFNAGDREASLAIKRPFVRTVALPPKSWTSVSEKELSAVAAPVLFGPLEKGASSLSYADYIKNIPSQPSDAARTKITIKAETMALPEKALKMDKIGASGKIVSHWDSMGTEVAAHIDVPTAGWYRLKIRYCSGEEPSRSVLIGGKLPFAEAEAFALPATVGVPPSDGWSNMRDDWREVTVGAEDAPPGWKFYLPQGPCDLSLRNDGGGLNLDWLELEPAW